MESNLRMPVSAAQVEMGVKVSQYPIEQYKVSENVIDLITILTKDPIVTKTCFHDKIGFRFHEIPESQEVGLLPRIHYNFLIALWNCDKAGSKIYDNRYQIFVLSTPDKGYSKLVKKANLNGDLRQIVLQTSLEGGAEVKYQAMDFEVTQIKPPYITDKELFEAIKRDVMEFKQFIPHVIASAIDGVRFKNLWNTEGTAIDKGEESRFGNKGMVNQQAMAANNVIDMTQKGIQQIGTMREEDFDFKETPKNVVSQQQVYSGPITGPAAAPVNQPANKAAEDANQAVQNDQANKFFNAGQSFSFEEK